MDDESSEPGSYEYAPLRLPTDLDTLSAQARLSIAAEYGGWELAKVRRYADGTRQVTLRRKLSNRLLPRLSF
ncbi:MAG TPA: DUF5703 family protein [Stackebrandtia sp.]|uniref:DUF5703 family protein n=1 Tax=Stackebrandtia sp. TaxID=2023065 RepID=UPI002D451B6B|nr:DUF5703 family protein [Stackebrandtia sp.]HZE38431.1 DUF5703 family protein [Stackebrandtia sp.]